MDPQIPLDTRFDFVQIHYQVLRKMLVNMNVFIRFEDFFTFLLDTAEIGTCISWRASAAVGERGCPEMASGSYCRTSISWLDLILSETRDGWNMVTKDWKKPIQNQRLISNIHGYTWLVQRKAPFWTEALLATRPGWISNRRDWLAEAAGDSSCWRDWLRIASRSMRLALRSGTRHLALVLDIALALR